MICMGPMIVPENQVVTSLTLNYFLHLTRNSVAQPKTINTTTTAKPLPSTMMPVQEKLKHLLNTSEVDLIRTYLNQTIRESDQTSGDLDESMIDEHVANKDKESLPKLDLRIDTSIQNRTYNSTDRKCTAFQHGYYPWIVAVYVKFGLGVQYHCTANLITSQHVILAGHCIQESKGSFIRAHQLILFFGKTKLSSWEDYIQTREVGKVLGQIYLGSTVC
uniref:Peptidase S1 domain-containing protein n=1 Tax=Cacopsylla melanoneura TaxID=428564 RepID=A0A8D9E785_9HEMI